MFDFNKKEVTVVRICRGGIEAYYHLSKGRVNWYLTKQTRTRYQPCLIDMTDDAKIVEELELGDVERHTGMSVSGLSITRDIEQWQKALNILDGRNDEPIESPESSASAVKKARGRMIPVTDLRHLYLVLQDFNSAEFHLAMAHEAERAPLPGRLAHWFRSSVEQFAHYENIEEAFHDPRKSSEPSDTIHKISRTEDLTRLLTRQPNGVGRVVDDPQLNFVLVDREIIPARTTGGALYYDGRPATAGTRLDWLLANKEDKHPIVAEVKVAGDKNPFYALVQALMYAAELVTCNQISRLRKHYSDKFTLPLDETDPNLPRFDIYLVLAGYNRASDIRCQILEVTDRLSERLIEQPAATAHLRRIACLEAHLDKAGQLTFSRLFDHIAQGTSNT